MAVNLSEILNEDVYYIQYFTIVNDLLNSEITQQDEVEKLFERLENIIYKITSTSGSKDLISSKEKLLNRPTGFDNFTIRDIFEGMFDKGLIIEKESSKIIDLLTFLRKSLQIMVFTNLKDLEEIFTATCFEEVKFASEEGEKYYIKISYSLRKILEM